MKRIQRPHVVGIDDGPFDKRRDPSVPVVAVMMEGADLVEAVAITRFPIDGDDAAGFLANWIASLRFAPALHGVVLGGITIAGLGVLNIRQLATRLGVPVMVANRQEPSDAPLLRALGSAGLGDRLPVVKTSPPARLVEPGLWVAHAGANESTADLLIRNCLGKSRLPEPLRVAHLIGAALSAGQSRGRP